jgi:molecular chaperone DnaK (HSP70)
MRLGIDFGTTRVVVAAADRGNFPIITFDSPDGAARDYLPPLIALQNNARLFAWDAFHAHSQPNTTLLRSIKRTLTDAGPTSTIDLGPSRLPVSQLLHELLTHLHHTLRHHSSLVLAPGEPLEVMLGVPANANSNQRFLTADAFRQAGFEVLGILNEPSAASIEYAHRLRSSDAPEPDRILVYDLGGGTFDVSLVLHDQYGHAVLATDGIPNLGGDDFDDILASLALPASQRAQLSPHQEFLLLEECRQKKEALHPNTRRIVIDLDQIIDDSTPITIPIADYYDACTPLVQATLAATQTLIDQHAPNLPVSLYITGGASELPIIGRLLKETFGRRVKRSAYTRAATAIGLALQASTQSACRLRERFTRHFGVWREADTGRNIEFDALFERGAELPAAGQPPLEQVRHYHPVHNIGHFRYLECSHRAPQGEPAGDITNWDEIYFLFDPQLAPIDDLSAHPIGHTTQHPLIEERYTADSTGAVTVQISNLTHNYSRAYRLGRWAAAPHAIRPKRTTRSRH